MNKTVNKLTELTSALIENISADFILPNLNNNNRHYYKAPTTEAFNNSEVKSQPNKIPTIKPASLKNYGIKPVATHSYNKKPTLNITPTSSHLAHIPALFKKSIDECTLCPDSKEYQKITITETLPENVYVMVISDKELDNDNKQYLAKILKSINLDVNNQNDVYLTALKKCKNREYSPEVLSKCFEQLEREIRLVNPLSLLVFGKDASELFTKAGADVSYKISIPIHKIDDVPLCVQNNIELKKPLHKKLLMLKDYFTLL